MKNRRNSKTESINTEHLVRDATAKLINLTGVDVSCDSLFNVNGGTVAYFGSVFTSKSGLKTDVNIQTKDVVDENFQATDIKAAVSVSCHNLHPELAAKIINLLNESNQHKES
ncbi:hypothetical protein [Vibrio owensii]|uniref:hypothetical protein n=1 Tax=Vibrio harveyi group TaxID=717610 RepID=UPI003CC6B13F